MYDLIDFRVLAFSNPKGKKVIQAICKVKLQVRY